MFNNFCHKYLTKIELLLVETFKKYDTIISSVFILEYPICREKSNFLHFLAEELKMLDDTIINSIQIGELRKT